MILSRCCCSEPCMLYDGAVDVEKSAEVVVQPEQSYIKAFPESNSIVCDSGIEYYNFYRIFQHLKGVSMNFLLHFDAVVFALK